MLRLTLRSGRDGRFLARVVDRGGFPFVLDFGDRRIIDDANQRLQRGFTMWRFGRLVTAAPQVPDMLPLLAEFYAGEGLLVFLEEPTWPGREGGTAPALALGDLGEADEPTEFAELPDEQTELLSIEDLPDLGPLLETAEVQRLPLDPTDPPEIVELLRSRD